MSHWIEAEFCERDDHGRRLVVKGYACLRATGRDGVWESLGTDGAWRPLREFARFRRIDIHDEPQIAGELE